MPGLQHEEVGTWESKERGKDKADSHKSETEKRGVDLKTLNQTLANQIKELQDLVTGRLSSVER